MARAYKIKDLPDDIQKELKKLQCTTYNGIEFVRGRCDAHRGISTARSANGARVSGYEIEKKILRWVENNKRKESTP